LKYSTLPQVKPEYWSGRPLLTTPEGGKVVVDAILLSLWQIADGKTFPEILTGFQAKRASRLTVAAGLACLVEAGLLCRDVSSPGIPIDPQPFASEALPRSLSGVIVAYNGKDWLPTCLNSLTAQSLPCQEIIIVDNASSDGTPDWVRSNYPDVRLIELKELRTFAAAMNTGIKAAKGDYLLLLNQDIRLDVNAAAHLMTAASRPDTAAAAANLRFMWAPQFVNGIGNEVRALNWGSDNFIGYLDLGQFRDLEDVPSICFAAALINRNAWGEAGALDEGFPMYYEDVEWSYRARLKGLHLRAAPQALVFHAFGGQTNTVFPVTNPRKLQNVVYGRLRFNQKLFSGWRRSTRIIGSVLQDLVGFLSRFVTLRFQECLAILKGWKMWLEQPIPSNPSSLERQAEVFKRWPKNLPPHIWRGLPELTWEQVCCYYLPLMISGKTYPVPEFSILDPSETDFTPYGWMGRYEIMWQDEGLRAILRDIWRSMRWSLG
jgi:GT2 family glycosyltransferase